MTERGGGRHGPGTSHKGRQMARKAFTQIIIFFSYETAVVLAYIFAVTFYQYFRRFWFRLQIETQAVLLFSFPVIFSELREIMNVKLASVEKKIKLA